jgi:hypothetical protein
LPALFWKCKRALLAHPIPIESGNRGSFGRFWAGLKSRNAFRPPFIRWVIRLNAQQLLRAGKAHHGGRISLRMLALKLGALGLVQPWRGIFDLGRQGRKGDFQGSERLVQIHFSCNGGSGGRRGCGWLQW